MRKALLAPVAVSLSFLWFSTLSGQTRTQHFVSSRPVARRVVSAKPSGSGPGPWVQMAKLTGSGQAFFGPVSISDDIVVVGHSTGSIQKNAYVFVKPPGGWKNMAQVAILTPSDNAGRDFALSASISGDTIAIGFPGANHGAGAVYLYVKPAGGWKNMTETAKLTSSVGQSALGHSVSISRDTIVAGAPGVISQGAGAAFVFVKPPGGWKNMTQTAELEGSDIAKGDNFGTSVGISGDTVVADAPFLNGQGKGYVFVKPATGWHDTTETAELTPSNGGFDQNFGSAAAIDGDTAVFSQNAEMPYGLYVFVRPQGGWRDMTQTAELTAPGSDFTFGNAVAIQGNLIVTGESQFTPNQNFIAEGEVFLYLRPKSGWKDSSNPNVTLTGSDARFFSRLGGGVAISGKSIVATSNDNGNGNISNAGAGYMFVHP
jgi:hypothetical protein